MEILFVGSVIMLLKVEIIFFFSVVSVQEFGSLVCKGVLVCLVCLTGRFCWQRVVELGRRKPCWGFYAGWFMGYGKLGMPFGYVVFLALRSKFLRGYFGKLEADFLEKVLLRSLEKTIWFVSFGI